MFNIKIITIGKIKEKWLKTALDDYEKRMKGKVSFEWILTKNDEQLIKKINENASGYICLDIKGKLLSSEEFSELIFDLFQKNKLTLTFIIGGALGLPAKIKEKSLCSLSFSPLTFTHQMTRLILTEQIYRAFEIIKGSNYHK